MIRLELPKALCSYADDKSTLELDGPYGTVGEALVALRGKAPAALDRIMDEQGSVRRHVNVFVNGAAPNASAAAPTAVADTPDVNSNPPLRRKGPNCGTNRNRPSA